MRISKFVLMLSLLSLPMIFGAAQCGTGGPRSTTSECAGLGACVKDNDGGLGGLCNGGQCKRSADSSNDCSSGYSFDSVTSTCEVPLGCDPGNEQCLKNCNASDDCRGGALSCDWPSHTCQLPPPGGG